MTDTKVSKGGIAIVALTSAQFLMVLDQSVINVWVSSAQDDPARLGGFENA